MNVSLRTWRIVAVAVAVVAAMGIGMYWNWYQAEGYMLYLAYPTALAQYLAAPVLAHALAFAVFSLPVFGGAREPVRKPLLIVSLVLWTAYLAWFILTMGSGMIGDPVYSLLAQSILVVQPLLPWVPLLLGILAGLAAKR